MRPGFYLFFLSFLFPSFFAQAATHLENQVEEVPSEESSETSSSTSKKSRIKDTQHFLSLGFSTGFSVTSRLLGKNQLTGEGLQQLRFRSGVGAPLGFFVNFRVVDQFSIRAEFLSRVTTGAHVRNANRLSYPILMSLQGNVGFYYQFEFEVSSITWRPFVGFGLGASSSSFIVNHRRTSDNLTFDLYEFHIGLASLSWYGTFGYKFLLGKKSFLDLSLRFSRQAYAEALLDLSGLNDIGGDFETEEAVTFEISRNDHLKTRSFMAYDLLLSFGWWL